MSANAQKNATLAAPESTKFGIELVGLYAALALSSERAPVQEGIFQQPARWICTTLWLREPRMRAGRLYPWSVTTCGRYGPRTVDSRFGGGTLETPRLCNHIRRPKPSVLRNLSLTGFALS
jgi:hypothetical protein